MSLGSLLGHHDRADGVRPNDEARYRLVGGWAKALATGVPRDRLAEITYERGAWSFRVFGYRDDDGRDCVPCGVTAPAVTFRDDCR